jgi:hypothetical protein
MKFMFQQGGLGRVGKAGTVSGGGSGSHRYWRFSNFTGTTNFFETTEIGVMQGATDRALSITPTASASPGGGSLASLVDGGPLSSSQTYWNTSVANTLQLTWDLAAAYAIDGFRVSRFDTAGRFPTAFTVEWSDNNSSWTTVGTYSLTQPGTNYTLSAISPFP